MLQGDKQTPRIPLARRCCITDPEGASLRAASEQLDPVLKQFFAEGWRINNPRETRARLRAVAVDLVLTDTDLFTDEELDRGAVVAVPGSVRAALVSPFSLRDVWEADPFLLSLSGWQRGTVLPRRRRDV